MVNKNFLMEIHMKEIINMDTLMVKESILGETE